MKAIENWDNVKPSGEYERLAPGGYVCRILEATDDPQKEYLRIVYDIAEGIEAGRYKDESPENVYRHSFIRSYKEKAQGMFKSFINAVENSNEKYSWNWKEETLKGKLVGLVFGYEQYEANDGTVKERLRVASTKSADAIRNGDFRTPALKLLKTDGVQPTIPEGFVSDEDYPF